MVKNMKRIAMVVLAAAVMCGIGVSAQASSFPFNIDQLIGPDSNDYLPSSLVSEYLGDLSGDWLVTALAWEAGNTNYFAESGTNLFVTGDISNFGDFISVNMGDAYFGGNGTSGQVGVNDARVHIYTVTQELLDSGWTVPWINDPVVGNAPTPQVGWLIIGFNDGGSSDSDYDDLILMARPVPIPGALWLLGSGLIGLVGLRGRPPNNARSVSFSNSAKRQGQTLCLFYSMNIDRGAPGGYSAKCKSA